MCTSNFIILASVNKSQVKRMYYMENLWDIFPSLREFQHGYIYIAHNLADEHANVGPVKAGKLHKIHVS